MALRLRAMAAPGYARGFDLTLHADRLDQPLERNKSTVYFVCSMADPFHANVPDVSVRTIGPKSFDVVSSNHHVIS